MGVCVVSRSRKVQLHTTAVPAERQLRAVRRGGASVSCQSDGGRHGDALPAGEPLLLTAARYYSHLLRNVPFSLSRIFIICLMHSMKIEVLNDQD